MQVGQFRVLPAQLDDDVSVRTMFTYSFGFSNDFLDERNPHRVCNLETARAGDRGLHSNVAQIGEDIFQKLSEFTTNICLVTAIVGKDFLSLRVEGHRFDSGGAHINSEADDVCGGNTHTIGLNSFACRAC